MVEWAHRFSCEVWLHEADREWVMRDDPSLRFWSGETASLGDGLTLIRCGGHFAGGTVLHRGRDLLVGDVVQVIPDRDWVSFMYSFPNHIPLPEASIRALEAALEPFDVRAHLRRLVGHRHPGRRQGHRAPFRTALCRRPARETAMKCQQKG